MKTLNVSGTTLALCALALLAVAPKPAAAQSQSFREGKWQFAIPINFVSGKKLDGEGESFVDLNSDVGWGISFGYNLTQRFMLGFETTWLNANYDASVEYDDNGDGTADGTANIGGRLDAASLQAVGQFNALEGKFTPFVRGNLGFTYTDSSIPSAPPQGACWWDPWWGYTCGTWQPTYDRTSFSFGGGLGGRAEFGRSFFLEASFNVLWISFSQSTPSFTGVRVTAGWAM